MIESKPGKLPFEQYISSEQRYKVLRTTNPEEAKKLALLAEEDIKATWRILEGMSKAFEPSPKPATPEGSALAASRS